jgi:Holliday junction DNA helicase RuvA
MIAHLSGQLLRRSPQAVVVDVGGVGYQVQVPLSTFYRLGEEGCAVSLLIHTHVREDTLALFGFATAGELTVFEKLIGVAGVGPKLALNILSGIETPELIAALRASDLARLTRVPGVGKKTAERLILELKDKLPPSVGAEPAEIPAPVSVKDDLVSALANLGYSRAEADRAVDRILRGATSERFDDLLRQALLALSGR